MTAPCEGNPDRAARGGPPVRVGDVLPGVMARLLSTMPDTTTPDATTVSAAIEPRAASALTYGDLPPSERPGQRLTHHGPEALTTEEIVALITNTARNWDPVTGPAKTLLALANGRIGNLTRLDSKTIQSVHGIGPVHEVQLRAACALSRRWQNEPTEERPLIRKPTDIVMRFAPSMRDLKFTECRLVILDTQQAIARTLVLGRNTSCHPPLDERTVFQAAIAERAAAFALVHNHPNGDSSPSLDDMAFTRQLSVSARQVIEIPLYDHVIIGRETYVSFLERQWI